MNARPITVEEYITVRAFITRYIAYQAITDDAKIRDTWAGVFQHDTSLTFFENNATTLSTLSTEEFHHAVRAHCIGTDWVDAVCGLMVALKQDTFLDQAFDALYDRMVQFNLLLKDTKRGYSEDALRTALNNAMTERFRDYLKANDVDNAGSFADWLKSVKDLDKKYRLYDRKKDNEFDARLASLTAMTKQLEAAAKRTSTSSHYNNDHTQKKPNTSTYSSSSNPKTSTSSTDNTRPSHSTTFPVPKWAIIRENAAQKALMDEAKQCGRCRDFYANHFSKDCNKPGPVILTVPYRDLTRKDVEAARQVHEQTKKPITLDAVLKFNRAPPIAVIQPDVSSIDDLSQFLTSQTTSSHNTVAAIFGGRTDIMHTAHGAMVYDKRSTVRVDRSFASTSTLPVAAVINEVDSDDESRFEDISDSDDDKWEGIGVNASPPTPSPPARKPRNPEDDDEVSTPSSILPSEPSFKVAHMFWEAMLPGPNLDTPLHVKALIDDGSHLVLIRNSLVEKTGLRRFKLPKPESISVAVDTSPTPQAVYMYDYVKLSMSSPCSTWTSRVVYALVAPDSLCVDIILGQPFLQHNKIVVDYEHRTVVDKCANFDLLNPVFKKPTTRAQKHCPKATRIKVCRDRLAVLDELKIVLRKRGIVPAEEREVNFAAVIKERLECLEAADKHRKLTGDIIKEYSDVFGEIPRVSDLPADVTNKITLKDSNVMIQTRSYSSPRKYKEAWATLIKNHLEAGRIRPSNSSFSSPAFLIPKSDPNALPRWVNDYRQLNANTVPDRHPLPLIEDILRDCTREGTKFWGKMDMTDAFFQNLNDPETIPLTAVNTPLGLYEWVVMPQGLRNAPAVQQRRVTKALREYIGVFCHVYLDDIIIWSKSEEEHAMHIRLILDALRKEFLYCNPKKCEFFKTEIDFLGYHISRKGVEAQTSKVDAVLNFPRPTTAEETRRFLGLVRFIAGFLENLAEYTRVLTPLTKKECNKNFPEWTLEHEKAFIRIKELVTSRAVLTSIDHANPGDNKIFLVCDASNWRTGSILLWGPTLKEARPVAFDSTALSGPELNYPVHEKELLAIVRALRRWRSDCIGMTIHVLTDHRTLENFTSQKDLSRRQLRWQEFLSQYELVIAYIKGTDNTGADALSRVANGAYLHEIEPKFAAWPGIPNAISAVLTVESDDEFLKQVKAGYKVDKFILKLTSLRALPPGITNRDGLWYVDDRLVIPRYAALRENLFRVAHDSAGHFGFDKSYAYLRTSYYWPNMRRDLEHAYVPACDACQRNKSTTKRRNAPLHPLPVPDARLKSVGMDFVGPLPEDEGYNCILTMTCRLNSDIKILPTRTNLDAEGLALLFFREWYCDNGMPEDIVVDRDKLFMSKFWKALMRLTGTAIKASSSYHPESDGRSERSNKTVVQALRYFVDRKQKGWVAALPRIRFHIMNTVNASTGLSGFELKTGRSPRILPTVETLPKVTSLPETTAKKIITDILDTEAEAKDALLAAKVVQAFHADKNRGDPPKFKVGDRVLLTTVHRRNRAKREKGLLCAKFYARYDGPYKILRAHPETDAYTLDMPASANPQPSYNVEDLSPYIENDDELFPTRKLARPGPVMAEGVEEYELEAVVDARRRGRGWQFKVSWVGYGEEDERWLSYGALKDCEVLDEWVRAGGDGPQDLIDSVRRDDGYALATAAVLPQDQDISLQDRLLTWPLGSAGDTIICSR